MGSAESGSPFAHGNAWFARRQETAAGVRWRATGRRYAVHSTVTEVELEEMRYGGLPIAPEEDCLWDGNPTWQGDIAPPRPTLRRVPDEWDDLVDDYYVEELVEQASSLVERIESYHFDYATDTGGCAGEGVRANSPGYDQCPVCRKRVVVRNDGTFRKHGYERAPYAPGLAALGEGE